MLDLAVEMVLPMLEEMAKLAGLLGRAKLQLLVSNLMAAVLLACCVNGHIMRHLSVIKHYFSVFKQLSLPAVF